MSVIELKQLLDEENQLTQELRAIKERLPAADFQERQEKLNGRLDELDTKIEGLTARLGKREALESYEEHSEAEEPLTREQSAKALRLALMDDSQRKDFERERRDPYYKNFRDVLARRAEKSLVQDGAGDDILAPPETQRRFIEAEARLSLFLKIATVEPISALSFNMRWLTTVNIWQGKRETKTDAELAALKSNVSPDDRDIYVEDTNADVEIGHDMLADTDLDLTGHLTSQLDADAALHRDNLCITGRGHAFQEPEGLKMFIGGTYDYIQTVPAQGAAALEWNDTIELQEALDEELYGEGARWLAHPKVRSGLRTAQDSSGRYIWLGREAPAEPLLLHGKPIHTRSGMDQIPAPGGATAHPLMYGNFKKGQLKRIRLGMTLDRDKSAQKGRTVLCWTWRWTSTVIKAGPIWALEVAGS